MERNNFIIMFISLCLFACNNSKQQQFDEIQYDASVLENGEFIDLSLTDISSDFLFSTPRQIDFVTDSLLVVFDNKTVTGKLAHLFTKSGKPVGSFGMIGKGHGEMIYPYNICVGEDNRSVYFFDWRTSNSVRFMVDDILAGRNVPVVIHLADSLDGDPNYRFSTVYRFNDKDYIATGYNDEMRIMTVKDNRKVDNYTSYPKVDENEEYTWSIWSNSLWVKFGVTPNRKYLVNTTRIGMLFEIFELNEGKIESKVLKAFYKPEFGIAKGAQPACVIRNEKTISGFFALYCTDKSFWGVIGGPGSTHYNEIYEFNYSGDLLNKYKVKGDVVCLAVNAEDEMYLIMMDKNGEQHLMKADLKSVSRKRAV